MTLHFAAALALFLPAAQHTPAYRTYADPETGVLLRYPAAWTEALAGGYGADPLVEDIGKGPKLPKPRLRVGWAVQSGAKGPSGYQVNSVSFTYSVLGVKNASACRKQFDGWDSDTKPEDIQIHDVPFHHVSYSEAGLGHSWSFELYTAFRDGRCLAFSVGANSSHPDEPMRVTKAQRAVPASAVDVFRTLHLATPASK